MQIEQYKLFIKKSVMSGDDDSIDLIAKMLFESQEAKQVLRDMGYGCTGKNLLETVKEVKEIIDITRTNIYNIIDHI